MNIESSVKPLIKLNFSQPMLKIELLELSTKRINFVFRIAKR